MNQVTYVLMHGVVYVPSLLSDGTLMSDSSLLHLGLVIGPISADDELICGVAKMSS